MRRAIYAFVLGALCACSDIDKDERLIYAPVEIKPDSRAVLIEDFTGQKCSKCPAAAVIAEGLVNLYGEDKVILVAIHSSSLGFEGTAKLEGLMTDTGKAYGEKWGVTSPPIGLVNRVGGLLLKDKWTSATNDELQKTTTVKIKAETAYDETTKTLTVKTTVESGEQFDGNLQLWLTQDNIIGYQAYDDAPANLAHTHNHVFRAAINNMDGEDINFEVSDETHVLTATFEHTYVMDGHDQGQYAPALVPADCSVIAIVSNKEGVQQVIKKACLAEETSSESN